MPDLHSWIQPVWPALPRVRAISTTRSGGFSRAPFEGLNLAEHVGDNPVDVGRNRELLHRQLQLPEEPCWLTQVHGTTLVEAESSWGSREADGAFSAAPGKVCAVLTADCLPLLLCNRAGTQVAAVHAGWRGLASGVIEAALAKFTPPKDELLAWLGPAIGPTAFEVGEDVRERFIGEGGLLAEAFVAKGDGKWMADIYKLARHQLALCGVTAVFGGDCCTFSDRERFFSYRRDGQTGRMATLIWMEPKG